MAAIWVRGSSGAEAVVEGRREGESELRVWMREVSEVEVVSSELESEVARVYLRRENVSERAMGVERNGTHAFSRSFSACPLFPLQPALVELWSTRSPICAS